MADTINKTRGRANNQLIAKGEVIVAEDRLGVTVNSIMKSAEMRQQPAPGKNSNK